MTASLLTDLGDFNKAVDHLDDAAVLARAPGSFA